jgi:hypothetical protein
VDVKPLVGYPIAILPTCSVPEIVEPVLYAKGRDVAILFIIHILI